ncbi:transglycosylase domain-containing protein [Methylocystis parvus]|uniref:transglycosylase domain-containing protein n=1 Tax=Methylocystis parvus TaxID=134 RepID=UPI003C743428
MAVLATSVCGFYWYAQRDIPDLQTMNEALKQRSSGQGGYTRLAEIPQQFICAFMSDPFNANGLEYLLAGRMLEATKSPMRQIDWHVKRAIVSWRIGKAMVRSDILETLLNGQYFGRGGYGVAAGAKTHFGVDATQLSLAQTAYLVGLTRSPATYDAHPEQGRKRRDYILDRMQASGCASEAEIAKAKQEALLVLPLSDDAH